jgi:hypothetical protein
VSALGSLIAGPVKGSMAAGLAAASMPSLRIATGIGKDSGDDT